MMGESYMIEIIVPAVTATVTALSTYILTKGKSKQDNQQYIMDKVQELFENSQAEIRELKAEIKVLSEENIQLRLEIVELREQLVQKGVQFNEG